MVDAIEAVAGSAGEVSGGDLFRGDAVAGTGVPWGGASDDGASFQAHLDRAAADRPVHLVQAVGDAPADAPSDTRPPNPYERGAEEPEEAWLQRLQDATNAATRRYGSDPTGAVEELGRINEAIARSPGFADNYPAYAQHVSPHFFNNPTTYNVREVPTDPYLAGLSVHDRIAHFNATNVNPGLAIAANGTVYDISRDHAAIRQTAPWTAAVFQENERLIAQHGVRSAVQERGLAGIPPEVWGAAALGLIGRTGRTPRFDGLRDHWARHGIGNQDVNGYYNSALRHMETGTRFRFYHNGEFRHGFVTRTGPDSFIFTSASQSGNRIFTHMQENVNTQYLRNIGITLPTGF